MMIIHKYITVVLSQNKLKVNLQYVNVTKIYNLIFKYFIEFINNIIYKTYNI